MISVGRCFMTLLPVSLWPLQEDGVSSGPVKELRETQLLLS